jgi:hypothetical protein
MDYFTSWKSDPIPEPEPEKIDSITFSNGFTLEFATGIFWLSVLVSCYLLLKFSRHVVKPLTLLFTVLGSIFLSIFISSGLVSFLYPNATQFIRMLDYNVIILSQIREYLKNIIFMYLLK